MNTQYLIKNVWVSCLFLAGMGFSANDFSANYHFDFVGGNLISNWSFEHLSEELCKEPSFGTMTTDCHFFATNAQSGSYVLDVWTESSATFAYSQKSDFLSCVPNTAYSLSFFINATWASTIDSNSVTLNAPSVWLYKGDQSIGSPVVSGTSYESIFERGTPGWKKYVMTFTTGSEDVFIKLGFVTSANSQHNSGNHFQIDNVLLFPSSNVAGVLERRQIGDAAGRMDEGILNDGARDIISFTTYDERGRTNKAYLPAATNVGTVADLTDILVGTKLQGENFDYDYPTLEEAYSSVKSIISGMDASKAGTPIISVIVSNDNDLVPIQDQNSEFTFMSDRNLVPVSFEIQGIVRGSPEYLSLVSRHTTSFSLNHQYSFSDFTNTLLPAQYPGVTNPFVELQYPSSTISSPVSFKMAYPGPGYEINSTVPHVAANGIAYVSDTNIPNDIELTTRSSDISGAAAFIYTWSRDLQGKYRLNWTNTKNQLVKEAIGSASHFSATTYTYDDQGHLVGTTSPELMNITREYNAQNQLTASVDPDKGRTEYLYNQQGELRFIHPQESVATYMIANKYDVHGRLIETGKTNYNWSQDSANIAKYPSTSLDVGYFYDEISSDEFQRKTGISLSSLTSSGFDLRKVTHTFGHLAGSYNLNSEVNAPGLTAPERKLVACFYAYDMRGRLQYIYHYLGQLDNLDDRMQKIKINYDSLDRIESRIVFNNYKSNETTDIPSSRSDFLYDERGRVSDVLDKDARVMVHYDFTNFGQISSVTLYNKFQIRYKYDLKGEIVETDAVRLSPLEYIFSEKLGYQQKPDTNSVIPQLSSTQQRWDGKISSALRKFSKDVANNNVEVARYDYDDLGRLIKSERNRSAGSLLNPDGSINFSGLSFPNQEVDQFSYNDDGGLLSHSSPGVTHNYSYRNNNGPTHQISNVSGLRRSGESLTSVGGDNFQYDPRGRLTIDSGLGKSLMYGFASNQPVKVRVGNSNYHMFYDEAYSRVAEVGENAGTIFEKKIYLYETGLKLVKEFDQVVSSNGVSNQVKNSLFGQRGMVGIEDEATGNKKLFVKDHLGSVVKVLDENQNSASGEDEYAYAPYGFQEQPVVSGSILKPTGTYIEKEYENALKTYYHGKRFFDPDIAMWLTPDPENQFFSPYTQGGDPINYVDASGASTEPASGGDATNYEGAYPDNHDMSAEDLINSSEEIANMETATSTESGGNSEGTVLPEVNVTATDGPQSDFGNGDPAGGAPAQNNSQAADLTDVASTIPGVGEGAGGGAGAGGGYGAGIGPDDGQGEGASHGSQDGSSYSENSEGSEESGAGESESGQANRVAAGGLAVYEIALKLPNSLANGYKDAYKSGGSAARRELLKDAIEGAGVKGTSALPLIGVIVGTVVDHYSTGHSWGHAAAGSAIATALATGFTAATATGLTAIATAGIFSSALSLPLVPLGIAVGVGAVAGYLAGPYIDSALDAVESYVDGTFAY